MFRGILADVHDDATPATDVSGTAGRLRISVARLARLLRRQNIDSLGATLDAALASLDREGPLTLGELAAVEQIAPPSVTRIAGKLEDAGLVVRRFDRPDRRVCRLELTPEGRRHAVDNRSRRHAWLAGQLEGLPADDLATLERALEVLERLSGTGAPVKAAS
jgi:DNA-binding MarR family transcriptional regulator